MGRIPFFVSTVVVVVVCLSAVPGARGDCPAGWTQANNTCYFASTMNLNWVSTLAYCGQYNATPVTFSSEAEWNFVMNMLRFGASRYFWTGLNYNTTTKHWFWIDNTPYNSTATHWVNNREGMSVTVLQTCSVFLAAGNYINVYYCSSAAAVLCKRPATAYDVCDESAGWTDILGQCMKVSDVPKSWYDANATCSSYGGGLFAPHNVTEWYALGDMGICKSVDSSFWIGISDVNSPNQLKNIDGTYVMYAPYIARGNMIIKPGGTCVQSVTNSNFAYATDDCTQERRFLCYKPHGTCPQGWQAYGGSCYLLQGGNQKDAWADANQTCQTMGTHLVIINSADELQFIGNIMNDAKVDRLWIGLSDNVQDNVQQWVDGTPLTYKNFDNGWPHNTTGKGDCAYVRRGSNPPKWYTDYCFQIREFVCEMPITQTSLTATTPLPSFLGCDEHWKLFNRDCYYFGHGKTFSQAEAFCVSNNGHLTTIRNPLEQSFLTESLGRSGYSFIGLQRDRTRNGFYWISDGSLPTFTNWLPGEPNDAGASEECAMMVNLANSMPGAWNDDKCNVSRDFICRKDAGFIAGSGPTPAQAITAPDIRRCGIGWNLNYDDDNCYQINADNRQTWDFARADCVFKGGDLASINGPKQQIHLQATIMASAYGKTLDNFWVGATDKTKEGGWTWSDGSPFRYLNWHPGEPNDSQQGEDCAEIVGTWQYQWNDKACSVKNPYICKKPAILGTTAITPVPTPVITKGSCQGEPLISGSYSVSDESLIVTSTFDVSHGATQSRIFSGNNACWRPSFNTANESITAVFYNILIIKGVTTKGCSSGGLWVTSYQLQYQFDFYSPWYWYEDPPGTTKVFSGNTDGTTPVTNNLMFPIEAKSIRLVPTAWHGGIGLQWELLGCVEEDCYPDFALSGPLLVEDGGWSASSSSDTQHFPSLARLQPLDPKIPPACWRPQTGDASPWIQVDIGSVKVLRGVTTQGNPNANEWVTGYQLAYRLNSGSTTFKYYTEPYGQTKTFIGNTDNNSSVTQYLKSHVQAQVVKLIPTSFHTAYALRFDLLVCPLGCREIPLISGPSPVADQQLSASTSLNSEHGPQRARLNQPHQGDFAGGWEPEVSDTNQFIQVDLGTTIQVQAVATQGREDQLMFIRSYTLSYSIDGTHWYPYFEGRNVRAFDANWDSTTPRKHYLSIPMMARFVRLWPRDWNQRIALRWELYGCPGPMSGQAIGCYADVPGQRDLPFESLSDPAAGLWPPMCIHHCYLKGYYYAGLQNGDECYCGNTYGRYGPGQNCSVHCFPRQMFLCGGKSSNFVYTTGLTSQDKICKEGWTGYGSVCFKLMTTPKSWTDARTDCQSQGGELTSLGSQHEQDFAFSLLSSAGDAVWTGFNDRLQEMFFEWSNDDVVVYTNWDAGQPNAQLNTNEDCVSINAKTGGWQDDDCNLVHPYLCKANKQPTDMPTLAPVVSGCEQGWEAFRWSCYLYVTQPQMWQDSQQVCQSLSGSLVKIDDRFEQAYLSSSLGQKSGNFWTDVADTQRTGNFHNADGSPYLALTNWAKDKPDKNGSCVAVGTGSQAGLWYNQNCSAKTGFICERVRVGYTTPTPPSPTPPMFACPDGWVDGYAYCYQINAVNNTRWKVWSDARKDCVSQGAELASFHNDSVLDNIWRNYVVGSNNNFWVGLTNLNSKSGYVWTDGSPLQFIHWADKEPNNAGGRENCGELRTDLGAFNDMACFSTRNWICSIKKGQSVSPRATMMVPSSGPPGSCAPLNDTWLMFNGSCYTVGADAQTWRDARIACRSNNAELASIGSMLENNFINQLMHQSGQFQAWVGFSELDWTFGFRWSDGTPTKFVYWTPGEPNDASGAESCVTIYSYTGKWNDNHCAEKYPYVCKKNLAQPFSPTISPVVYTGFCPAGYKTLGTKCYKVMGGWSSNQPQLNWTAARQSCQSQGLGFDLASITSDREQAMVTTLLQLNTYQAWVGLQRRSGTWRWIDNEDLTFSAWKSGEPNGGDKEQCGMLTGTTRYAGLWYDTNCAEKAMYICQTRILSTIPTPESVPPSCDPGYSGLGKSCFKFVSTPSNYSQADSFCRSQGAFLASVKDSYEQSFLYLIVTDPANFSPLWIGMSDQQQSGVYTWADGWPVLFTNWGTMEPSKGQDEGCVSLDKDGTWDDDVCSKQFGFICKKSSDTPPYTPAPSDGLCASDWNKFGSKCYRFFPDTYQQFSTAIFDCQERGGALVTIHDQATNDFIKANIEQIISGMVWLGLYGSQQMGYSWRDNSPVQFTNWDQNEPSGADPNGQEQHCVEFRTWNGKWNDLACSNWRGYVCERPAKTDSSPATFPVISNLQSVPTPAQPSWPKQSSTRNPNTQAPNTQAPNTQAPNTQPPVTQGPVITQAPNTQGPPVSQGQLTLRPPTQAPNTQGPNTQGPQWTPSPYTSSPQKRTQAPSKLSGGAVAGIVIAIIIVITLALVATAYFWRRKHPTYNMPGANEGFTNAIYDASSQGVKVGAISATDA